MLKIILWSVGLILLTIVGVFSLGRMGSKGSRAEEKRYGVKSMEELPEHYIDKFNDKNSKNETENN